MGKQGPCCHCGVTSTPLWRNGPPDKPVLCNACGSRWRTKGSLTDYTPLHLRAEPDQSVNHKATRIKILSSRDKEAHFSKRKRTYEDVMIGCIASDYSESSWKVMDDSKSNRSSSGSAFSNSESYAPFGSANADEMTGPSQSFAADNLKLATKRICIPRPKSSSIAKLIQDLCTILHQQQASGFSESSDEDLLFESSTSMFSDEIGHGSYLIKDPSCMTWEEESEASSFSVDNRSYLGSDTCSYPNVLHVNSTGQKIKLQIPGKGKSTTSSDPGVHHKNINRNLVQSEMFEILGSQTSPLPAIDLKDVITLEGFLRHLSTEEQAQLLKSLPPADACGAHNSLQIMFNSSHFVDSFFSFQQMIAEGVFDTSLSGVRSDDCNTLKRLLLCNLNKSEWVESYNVPKLQKSKKSITSTTALTETKSSSSCPQNQYVPVSQESKPVNNDLSTLSPRNLFALPSDSSPGMLSSLSDVNENRKPNLLLDVSSINSFPEAELSFPSPGFVIPHSNTSNCSMYNPDLIGE